jgi:hypothetical protein
LRGAAVPIGSAVWVFVQHRSEELGCASTPGGLNVNSVATTGLFIYT